MAKPRDVPKGEAKPTRNQAKINRAEKEVKPVIKEHAKSERKEKDDGK